MLGKLHRETTLRCQLAGTSAVDKSKGLRSPVGRQTYFMPYGLPKISAHDNEGIPFFSPSSPIALESNEDSSIIYSSSHTLRDNVLPEAAIESGTIHLNITNAALSLFAKWLEGWFPPAESLSNAESMQALTSLYFLGRENHWIALQRDVVGLLWDCSQADGLHNNWLRLVSAHAAVLQHEKDPAKGKNGTKCGLRMLFAHVIFDNVSCGRWKRRDILTLDREDLCRHYLDWLKRAADCKSLSETQGVRQAGKNGMDSLALERFVVVNMAKEMVTSIGEIIEENGSATETVEPDYDDFDLPLC